VVIVNGELNGRYSCILFSMSAGAPYTQTLREVTRPIPISYIGQTCNVWSQDENNLGLLTKLSVALAFQVDPSVSFRLANMALH
jgi:hypothetical protein